MTGQTLELERPERVVEHSPGLTRSLDDGKEGLAVNATRIGAPVRNTIDTVTHPAQVVEMHPIGNLIASTRQSLRLEPRTCVNPDHLEVVTPALNSERANKPRVEATHCTHAHEWTPENTLRMGASKRCRQCLLVRSHVKVGRDCSYEAFCSDPVHERGKFEVADVCSRGHSMADAYVRPDGTGRLCRECRRVRDRKVRS